jgi:hypothetical protein
MVMVTSTRRTRSELDDGFAQDQGASGLAPSAVAAFAIALAACAEPAAAADGPDAQTGVGNLGPGKHIELEFDGSIAALPVVRAAVDVDVGPESYAGDITFKSTGLAGFFKGARVFCHGAGKRTAAGFSPVYYAHTEIDGKKRRDIRLDYEPKDVAVQATPPFGSLGEPAPTPAQKREAFDPLSMVLEVVLGAGEKPCSRTVPVFDSKLRYNLEFTPDGVEKDFRTVGYRGPAMRCRVFYHPVAGYDREDLAKGDVYATPVFVWLVQTSPGVYLPARVRVRYDAAGILPLIVSLDLSDARVREEDAGKAG